MTVSEDFASSTGKFRGELLAHCYRMLGSAEEAEDLVQETYLRAWRSYADFAGRSSLRTWLYRIATNVCLTALERRERRPLPSGIGVPSADPRGTLAAAPEVPWLRPLPGVLLAQPDAEPAAVVASRAGIRLAFVAALQYLSARQRAMLILRDVLDWPAADVADLLGTTTAAVNSGLRRARAQLAQALPAQDELAEPAEHERRAMLDRFAAAFENADGRLLAELLRQDAVLEMPPTLTWFAGREAVAGFFAGMPGFAAPGRFLMVPVEANGQPSFAVYQREDGRTAGGQTSDGQTSGGQTSDGQTAGGQTSGGGRWRAHGLAMPTVTATGIARIVTFLEPGLLASFGLPPEQDADTTALVTRTRRLSGLRLVYVSMPPSRAARDSQPPRPGTGS